MRDSKSIVSSLAVFAMSCLISNGAVAQSNAMPTGGLTQIPFDAYFAVGSGYSFGSYAVGGDSIDNTGPLINGRMTFAASLPNQFGFQSDGILDYRKLKLDDWFGSEPLNDPTTTAILAAHAFWRDSARGAVGLIGQYVNERTVYSAGGNELTVTTEHWLAGAEAQYYLGNLTLYGQAAYHEASLGYYTLNLDGSGFSLAGQARWFATPDWSFTLKGGYDMLAFDVNGLGGDFDQKTWFAGLRTEYRLSSMPLSLYSEVTYSDASLAASGGGGSTVHQRDTRLMVGFKYNFGAGTLFSRDRSGATFDPIDVRSPLLFII